MSCYHLQRNHQYTFAEGVKKHSAKYCLKKRAVVYYKVTTASFLNGLKIADADQLILALIFRFGVILVQKIGR